MKKLTKLAIGVAAVAGASYIALKLLEETSVYDKRRAREAEEFLKEKYGEDILDGKRIMLVKDEPATKATIAKDVVDYELHKES